MSDFQAQIDALNARVSALESQAATPNVAPAQIPATNQANGVKIGEVTPTSAVIWTRVTKHDAWNTTGPKPGGKRPPEIPADADVPQALHAAPGMPGQVRVRYSTDPELRDAQATDWFFVAADGDWKTAAAKIKVAGFSHAGQSCISTQRVLVHRSVAAEFTAALVEHVRQLVVGDPLDDATDVSALISTGERDRVHAWVREAELQGARIVAGGTVDASGVMQPTVVAGATHDMKVCALEVFGPVVTITEFDDIDEAFRLANDSRYGLQASIFTAGIDLALRAVRTLDYGGVLVNEVPTWRADQQPYGGLRDSGNTREGPAYSVREMTELRMVVLG